ncbi:L-amino acid N-acyltransferase YncA [Pilibacter termitis]|uniref:L-amino acid N-acyltransferase YncA n=1 Tax=Pilibacter termitis TaxID=263852 RepID=A0A1T4M7L6_9ENTE|nr:GNAT family N-acetyltransferase [Pilibacter termitis]SJZ63003.1 L-amino acid N-acyltransferase YncA [Pilibacter termitis]
MRTIRMVEPQDYAQLMKIENEIWTNDNSPVLHWYENVEEFQEKMQNATIVVALENEKILGFLNLSQMSKLESNRFSMLIGIGVAKNAQSSGVGRNLISWVKEYAREHGKHKIGLRVLSTNEKAIRFYEKNGFIEEGRLRDEFFIDGKFVDDVFMACFLE